MSIAFDGNRGIRLICPISNPAFQFIRDVGMSSKFFECALGNNYGHFPFFNQIFPNDFH